MNDIQLIEQLLKGEHLEQKELRRAYNIVCTMIQNLKGRIA